MLKIEQRVTSAIFRNLGVTFGVDVGVNSPTPKSKKPRINRALAYDQSLGGEGGIRTHGTLQYA